MLTISLILFPILTSLCLFFFRINKAAPYVALGASLVEFVLGITAFVKYDKALVLNYVINIPWIKSMGVNLYFGMDGLSLLLVLLTTVLVPLILMVTLNKQVKYSSSFYGLILLMQSALIGVFTCFDGLLFYIFWELALIPVYFICALWGGENRARITFKFFLYTMLGSLFMLAALVYLYVKTPAPHQFNLGVLLNAPLNPTEKLWVCAAFFLGFAIKIPVFPFHSWQPDTYTVAPTAGSMLLAGIMLKMGLYGLLRFLIPVCGSVFVQWGPLVLTLSVIGLLYGSIIAIKQQEIKRLIAYSSLAHVGLMSAAIFSGVPEAMQGAIYQMISHGVNVIALFFVADIIFSRTSTTQISELGGIAKSAPKFAVFFMIAMLGSVALPLTNGFVGEFLMLAGIAKYNFIVSGVAGISIILGAVYMFWLYQRTMYGTTKPATAGFVDLTTSEMMVVIPLVAIIIVMGVYPKPFLDIAKPVVDSVAQSIIKIK